jgi:glycosyltransferase involved in cell wall biosynthesis
MKILNISLDPTILDVEQKRMIDDSKVLLKSQKWSKKYWKRSRTAKRIVKYGEVTDLYDVAVPYTVPYRDVINQKFSSQQISDQVTVFGLHQRYKMVTFFKMLFKIDGMLWKYKYDVITVQDVYYLAVLGKFLSWLRRAALEIQVHGFEKFKGVRKLIAKLILPKADSIRVVSQRLKKQLIKEFNIEDGRITVARVYRKRIKITRLKHNSSKFIFLTVSRLVPIKNIGLQIKALSNVRRKLKVNNLELIIVGGGSERKELEELCDELDAGSYVNFVGHQYNTEKYYQQADAFLLTSNAEGWGTVVEEAASASLPIIMTDVGLAGEVIKDGESGIVIPVNDQQSLENAMVRIIENENLRTELGINAYKEVKELPNQEETIRLMMESWRKAFRNKNK